MTTTFKKIIRDIKDNELVETQTLNAENANITNLEIGDITLPALNDFHRHVSFENFIFDSGRWTIVRDTAFNWVYRRSASSSTNILSVDISEVYRNATNEGFKLNSISFIYKVSNSSLNSLSPSLKSKVHTDQNITLSGELLADISSLNVSVTTQPRVFTRNLTTPSFINSSNTIIVLEMILIGATSAIFDLYGITLNFTRQDYIVG